MKRDIEEINGIGVTDRIKYLGVQIGEKKDIFGFHKKQIIIKAQKFANQTYSVTEKSVNKLLIGKTFWKSLVLPSILHATAVMQMQEAEIEKMQTIENEVYRKILGAQRYAPNCTLRAEIGASMMKTRIIKIKLNYLKHLLSGKMNCY